MIRRHERQNYVWICQAVHFPPDTGWLAWSIAVPAGAAIPDDHNATTDTTSGALRVRRVAGHVGGEMLDLKLGANLAEDTFAGLYATLLRYKVLFFHD